MLHANVCLKHGLEMNFIISLKHNFTILKKKVKCQDQKFSSNH